jgi:hypothetical protein
LNRSRSGSQGPLSKNRSAVQFFTNYFNPFFKGGT